jgi:aspartyl-tRNA(Asn)/glutamyl-tRNA(Gln) amidotransferase subunit A
MSTADLLYLPVRELAARIRRRRLDPVELAEAYLERLERFGPALGAVVTLTRDRALAEARQARAEIGAGRYRGPLHGIPYGAKDLLDAAGYPTTWGAAPLRQRRVDRDATAIARLRRAGAVLVAKLATIELAGGMGYRQANATFTGPTRTPWNLDYWAGGSSAGPGAAVAAALVPFALGTETWGSIVTPAAFSGVTGLRPTYGRVSRAGAMALSWTLDKIGPLARTADDADLVLRAIAGPDPADPATLPVPYRDRPPRRRLRIGVLRGLGEGAQPEVRRNFEASLAVLQDVADLVFDVRLPPLPYNAAATLVLAGEMGAIFEDFVDSGQVHELTAPEDRIGGYPSQVVFAKDYLRALRVRQEAIAALECWFREQRLDAVVHPTRPTVAFPLDRPFREAYRDARGGGEPISGAANLAGLPSLAVPNGFGRAGLPTSLSFTGPLRSEATLVALGRAYQERTDWHRRRPPAFA